MPDYKRPPLIGAMIELRFSSELTAAELASISKKLKKDYPFEKVNVQVDMMTQISDRGDVRQITRGVNGRILENTDQQSIVIIMPQSLSVGTRAPYTGWEDLFATFLRIWGITKAATNFKAITRIGSRFTNRIDIPITDDIQKINIADYLNLGIQSPEGHLINSYDASLVIKLDDDFFANIRTATTEPAVPLTSALLLDMDLYCIENIPTRDDELLGKIALIRAKKNALFESFVTEKTRELFNRDIE